jgi:hypothetical protein
MIMGFRFSKRIKIAPGISINLSAKRGISASVGGRGLSHNVGLDGKRRTTASIPGTGISHVSETSQATTPARSGSGSVIAWLLVAAFIAWLIWH